VERFGFVGLPNAGKSSLYNALTGGGALAAPYAFATTDPNVGVCKVPDDRLDKLAEFSQTKSVIPASVQFYDIGGLVEGASKGEGLGNMFLAGIREVDAIVYVLRAFADEDVPGSNDPLNNLRILEIELAIADLDTVEKHLGKKGKAARLANDKDAMAELGALEAAQEALAEGLPIYRSDLSEKHRALLAESFLLTNKPVLAIVNIDESQLDDVEGAIAGVVEELGDRAQVFGASIQLEAEAATLEPDDRAEMLDGFGLGEGAVPKFIRAAYHALGLRTYFTTGEKETRAWTFRSGALAPEAAGVIHTDFQRGFIRAEVIQWQTLLDAGSWSAARSDGTLRIEGKDYEFQDGDVTEFRFNV
jgi:ribosome-binding ATPase